MFLSILQTCRTMTFLQNWLTNYMLLFKTESAHIYNILCNLFYKKKDYCEFQVKHSIFQSSPQNCSWMYTCTADLGRLIVRKPDSDFHNFWNIFTNQGLSQLILEFDRPTLGRGLKLHMFTWISLDGVKIFWNLAYHYCIFLMAYEENVTNARNRFTSDVRQIGYVLTIILDCLYQWRIWEILLIFFR